MTARHSIDVVGNILAGRSGQRQMVESSAGTQARR
jgi:hypothetical protein